MIQRASLPSDPRLTEMVQAIAAAVDPVRIILFGSRARGDDHAESDYDFAIELAFGDTERTALSSRLSAAAASVAPHESVDFVLRNPGELTARGGDPGYLDWDIVREGIVVYEREPDSRGPRMPKDGRDAVREPPPRQSVSDWLAHAEDDRRAVETILRAGADGAWFAACFHAQQYAEKYLKILLVEAGEHPPRTHDLAKLMARARGLGYELADCAADCETLKPFAVAVRYPTERPIPTESSARAAWSAASRIASVAEAIRRRPPST